MKRILSYCLIGVMMFSGAFWGCSDKKEPALEQKSAIKKMTEETAREAVNQIRYSHRKGPFGCEAAGRKK